MKKNLTLYLLLLITISTKGQSLISSAYDKYKSGDYFSAVELYRQSLKQNPPARSLPFIYSMIGQCYVKLDSLPQAKAEFLHGLRSISENDFIANVSRFECSNYLADIFLNEKNYRTSLNYYQLSLKRVNGVGELAPYSFDFFNSGNQAKCYLALGYIDSAINIMSLQMFKVENSESEFFDHKIDSVRKDSVFKYYIELLKKKYTNSQIKKKLKKVTKSFRFQTEVTQGPAHNLNTNFYAFVNASNQHIKIYSFGIAGLKNQPGNKLYENLEDKNFIFQKFENMPICKLISQLPD